MDAPRPLRFDALPSALVAGGAGFLGSNLCRRLLSLGYRVTCIDNLQTGTLDNLDDCEGDPRFRFIGHDVCEAIPAGIEADIVFNLACAASPPKYQADPVHTMMTSVLGTRNLLDHAVAGKARFVQASTSEVYGDPKEHPQREDYLGNVNPCGPRACYDEGKRAAEALCFDYWRTKNANVRVARIFNTYGPNMSPEDGRIVSNFICQALKGHSLTIYGDGSQTRSFCYVDDLIDGLMALAGLNEAPAGPVNLGNPNEFTIRELADIVIATIGSGVSLVYHPLPEDDPTRRRPDIACAEQLLDWKPKTTLVRGLPPTIAWFSDKLSNNEILLHCTNKTAVRHQASRRSLRVAKN